MDDEIGKRHLLIRNFPQKKLIIYSYLIHLVLVGTHLVPCTFSDVGLTIWPKRLPEWSVQEFTRFCSKKHHISILGLFQMAEEKSCWKPRFSEGFGSESFGGAEKAPMGESSIRVDIAARILRTFQDHSDTRRANAPSATLSPAASQPRTTSSFGGVIEASPSQQEPSTPAPKSTSGRGRGRGRGRGPRGKGGAPDVASPKKEATPSSSSLLSKHFLKL